MLGFCVFFLWKLQQSSVVYYGNYVRLYQHHNNIVYEKCPKKYQDIALVAHCFLVLKNQIQLWVVSYLFSIFNWYLKQEEVFRLEGISQVAYFIWSDCFDLLDIICFVAYPGTTLLMLQNLTSKLFVQGAKYFVPSIPNPVVCKIHSN